MKIGALAALTGPLVETIRSTSGKVFWQSAPTPPAATRFRITHAIRVAYTSSMPRARHNARMRSGRYCASSTGLTTAAR